MANAKQAAAKRPKMAERARQLREVLFKGFEPPYIWDRKTSDGFITVPRILPITMQAIDEQSKGMPAGHTYFGLWARSPDHALVTVENQSTFATEAGFKGERAVDTWRRRMKQLRELSLIACKEGASGEFHYVLLINPILVMEKMHRNGLLQDSLYARFVERLAEIGALGELETIKGMFDASGAAFPIAATTASPTAK